jgi:serine/threonine-protein kinase
VGHRPFRSENAVTVAMMHIRDLPPPLPPDVPPGVRALVEATLVKDPRQRYRNGAEFAAAVAAVRAGLPLPTPSGLTLAGPPGFQPTGVPGPPGTPPSAAIPVQGGPPLSPPLPSPGLGGGTMPPSPPVPPPPRAIPQQRPRVLHPMWLLVGALVVVLVVLGVWALTQTVGHSTGTPRPAGLHQPVGPVGRAGQAAAQQA